MALPTTACGCCGVRRLQLLLPDLLLSAAPAENFAILWHTAQRQPLVGGGRTSWLDWAAGDIWCVEELDIRSRTALSSLLASGMSLAYNAFLRRVYHLPLAT